VRTARRQKRPTRWDAIVRGRNAGLYIAGNILKAKGVKVIVLEASDRVGGRANVEIHRNEPSHPSIQFTERRLGSDFPDELGAGLIE